MEEGKTDRFTEAIEHDYRECGRIQGITESRIGGNYSKMPQSFDNHKDRRGKEFVFHVASQEFKRGGEYCDCAIEFIKRGFEAEM